MDLLLEVQLQCFKWLWNVLLMGEQAKAKSKTGICYLTFPPLLMNFFFSMLESWLVLKRVLTKLPWHLINISTKIHPPFPDTVAQGTKWGFYKPVKGNLLPELDSSVMKCCVSIVSYKYQMLPFTELRLLLFSSLIYIIDICFSGFAPVFHYQLIYPGQPWQVSAEPHSLSRIWKFRSIHINLMNL